MLQNLPNNLACLPISIEQLLALLSFRLYSVVLVKQITKIFFLIEFAYQPVLDDVLCVIDEEVHDCFRYLIGGSFADDIKVGGDESTDEFRFDCFSLRELGRGLSERLRKSAIGF